MTVTRPLQAEPTPVDWLARAHELLRHGNTRDALGALWRFLVNGLHQRGLAVYEPELTNHEFVGRVARSSPQWPNNDRLRRLGQQLDRGIYGGADPTADEVDQLIATARELLA